MVATFSTRPPLRPTANPDQAVGPLANQIAENGWRGGMFEVPGNKDTFVVWFNPAIRLSPGPHLFARECHWNHHWSGATNLIVRFDINGKELINRKEVLFDKLHPHESWEDPRIFEHNGQTHIGVAAWYHHPTVKVNQCYAPLDEDDNAGKRVSPVYGGNGKDIFWQQANEKNWGWFSHDGDVHFTYSINPHVVVNARTLVRHETNGSMPWTLGELRGGTAPMRVGDEYLAFFHSSLPWKTIPKYGLRRRYFMGAYCFEAKPPFKPTRFTQSHLLVGSENDNTIPGSPAVVFPCGAAKDGESVLVTYGSNDCEAGWCRLGLEDLYRRMTPCN